MRVCLSPRWRMVRSVAVEGKPYSRATSSAVMRRIAVIHPSFAASARRLAATAA